MEETKQEETLETKEEVTETADGQNGEGGEDLKATNAKLYARAKKAEEDLKKFKEQQKKLLESDQTKEEPQTQSVNVGLSAEEVALMAKKLSLFDDEEIAFAQKVAKAEGVSIVKALESPEVKRYIDLARQDKKTKEQILSTTNKQGASGRTAEEIVSSGDIKKLSLEEQRKIFQELDKKYK